jgi:hypothetical protein
VKQDVRANTSSSYLTLEKVHELEDRVERNERNSRQMNLIIQGYVKNPAYNNSELREEKFYLKQLLERGIGFLKR